MSKERRLCNVRVSTGAALLRITPSALHSRRNSRRGVTLIELLMAVVIGAIAMFALVPSFVAERVFWGNTQRQTEAQRDGQMGMRAIARTGREGTAYTFTTTTFGLNANSKIAFNLPPGAPSASVCFAGGTPAGNGVGAGELWVSSKPCVAVLDIGTGIQLIDGIRSKVTNFTVTQVVPNKLVRVHLEVTHILRTTDTRTPGKEILETDLFLRNGT